MRQHHPNEKIRAANSGLLTPEGKWNGTVRFRADRLELPLHWRKPQVVMLLSDLYHPSVTSIEIGKTWDIMSYCEQHTFLVVTKRAQRAAELSNAGFGEKFPDNVYHFITMENQARADERAPYAAKIPGKVVILAEPLLSEINLGLMGIIPKTISERYTPVYERISGVITGGETGPGARPADLDWFRSLRDQCAAAGTPFYLKHVSKKAGRALDGQEHNELAWRHNA